MFAVINHLKNMDELKVCLQNLKNILKNDGKIIIDLHNPQASGKKRDTFDNMTRIMEWHFDKISKIEESKIIFEIDGKKYLDHHTFRIFTIEEIKEIYANYDINKKGCCTSKNLQFVISKNKLF